MRSLVRLFALALVVAASTPARATVDAFLEYTIPYQHLQTEDVCLTRQTMLASIGIPAGSVMRATFSPNAIFNENGGFTSINLIATTPPMVAAYVSDRYIGATMEYRMTVDVTALSAANGNTVAGRAATVRAAKLALLAMSDNLRALSNGNYRLWLTFIGLPTQTGLSGTRLHATTQYPYSGFSTLLPAYQRELIDVGGSCR